MLSPPTRPLATPLAFHPHPSLLSSLPSRRLDWGLEVSLGSKQGSFQDIPRRWAWVCPHLVFSRRLTSCTICPFLWKQRDPCLGCKRPRGIPLVLPFLPTHRGPKVSATTCCPLGPAQLPATPSSRTFPREVRPTDNENLATSLKGRKGDATKQCRLLQHHLSLVPRNALV